MSYWALLLLNYFSLYVIVTKVNQDQKKKEKDLTTSLSSFLTQHHGVLYHYALHKKK